MTDSELPDSALAEPSFESWREEISAIGGSSPLTHFRENSFGQINLDRAHPGGLAQFVTGRPTLLSNLVRDPLSFSRALSAAKRIKSKQVYLSDHFGLETLYMASGLVDLGPDGHNLRMPVLLWPVNLVTRHDDFELSLSRKAIVNPALGPSLQRIYGVRLNNEDLLSQVQVGSDPIPIRILDHIASLTEETGNPELKRNLVISNFSAAAMELAEDFRQQSNPIFDLFLGNSVSELGLGAADPILVTDADHVQTEIVSKALAGASFGVERLPGCGYLQSAILLLAALTNSGKRVLVLAPRRQTLNEMADRFAQLGLNGLAIRSSNTWLDMVSAISRNEKATADNYQALVALRDAAREDVAEYFLALDHVDGELGTSISEALEQLATLAASAKPPLNEARIDAEALGRHRDRAFALTLLKQACELGEFDFGAEDSSWFRAKFENPMEIESRIELAQALYSGTFQRLSQQLEEFTKTVEFAAARSVEDWVTYLELFVGIRESLDRFKPEVFDRSLSELILATAPRKDKSVMSGANRRRLKKLAKEYLRPGMHVPDMHQALKSIQQQREQWQRFCLVAKPPQVPLGIKEAQSAVGTFIYQLDLLQVHLDEVSQQTELKSLPLAKLHSTLRSLAEDTKILENFPERSMTQARLEEAGLGQLARELSAIHATKDALESELELAWWKSTLETLLARSGASLSADHQVVVKNEQQFAQREGELIAVGAKTVAHELSLRWKEGLNRYPNEAQTLKELLKLKRAVLGEVATLAPNIYRILAPAVMLSPYEVPTVLSKGDVFDVAVVLDGAGSTVAENYAGLSRCSQVIVFGDDAIARAEGFELECLSERPNRPVPESIFTRSRTVMPIYSLHHSYRTSGQVLGDYINREFYQDRITFEPTADSYFGRSHVSLVQVTGESSDSELNQTIELIFNHALWHPEDSLLVASISPRHAERLQDKLAAEMRSKAHLAEFFDGHGRERFEITTIAELAHRIADRVIFSVGFGSVDVANGTLGQIGDTDGRRRMANLLVSARKQITVVSAFGPGELADSKAPGAEILNELLEELVREPNHLAEKEVNPMIADLAMRLSKYGLVTRTNFSERVELVASVGDKAAIIEPDWGLKGDTLTDRHRIRPNLLRSMGWEYLRVPSFELFADPESVAQRIAIELGVEVSKKPQPLFELNDKAFEDTGRAWGDREDSNDDRLREDRPPHWG
ncbi:MAG: hypothetical protein ACKOXT_03045 [Actinomycetota bacterium]